MAARPASAVGRLAVERARARMPGLAPDSIEVVELARDTSYVVLRSSVEGVVVLDAGGRLVRAPGRLAAIGRHLRACARLREWGEAASLAQRLAEAEVGVEAIERLRQPATRNGMPAQLRDLRERLREFTAAAEAVRDELRRSQPPTERTLRRAVGSVNEAARADRSAVRATRLAAAGLLGGGLVRKAIGRRANPLTRWAVARLDAPDLPFLYDELSAQDDTAVVVAFVAQARLDTKQAIFCAR